MSPSDFVVTVHAFERFEQRFPALVKGMNDVAQAKFIHAEVEEALLAGRHSIIPPIELTSNAVERWEIRTAGSYFVWTQDKVRGYLLQNDPEEGLLVITVLAGVTREKASLRLRRLRGR